MFNISVLDGKSRLILDKNEIAITEEIAKQILKRNQIGKQLLFPGSNNSEKNYRGDCKVMEGHSLLPFDIYCPMNLMISIGIDQESQTFTCLS